MKEFMKDVMQSMREDFRFTLKCMTRWVILALVLVSLALAFTRDVKAAPGGTIELDLMGSIPTVIYRQDPMEVQITHETEPAPPPILHTIEEQSENNLFTEESHPDEFCIALNVYYEARADNLAGKYAVADVVLNRVNDPRFEDTPCKVVREGIYAESWSTAQHKDLPDEDRKYYPKRDRCQFSWWCDGKPDEPTQMAAWREAQTIAYNIVQFGTFRGITEGATHYHATYVAPDWSLEEWRYAYHLIGRIGAHIFYKWV